MSYVVWIQKVKHLGLEYCEGQLSLTNPQSPKGNKSNADALTRMQGLTKWKLGFLPILIARRLRP